MTNGNGKSALDYVRKDMTDAQAAMTTASTRLKACKLPDFKNCPAGGEEFHVAMAEMSHAQTDGIQALLQWQIVQVKREEEKAAQNDRRLDESEEPTEFKTKWFTARGVAAMWPVGVLAIAVVFYVVATFFK